MVDSRQLRLYSVSVMNQIDAASQNLILVLSDEEDPNIQCEELSHLDRCDEEDEALRDEMSYQYELQLRDAEYLSQR